MLPTLSQTIGQLNLYAYANNNPIMFTDETGESVTVATVLWVLATNLVIGAINGVVTSLVNQDDTVWAGLGAGLISGVFATLGIINPFLGRAAGSLSFNFFYTFFDKSESFSSDFIIKSGVDLAFDLISLGLYNNFFNVEAFPVRSAIAVGSLDFSIDTIQLFAQINSSTAKQRTEKIITTEGWKKLYWVGL